MPAHDPHPPVPRETVILVGMLTLTAFVMMLNETTLGVALPAIMADYQVDANTAQWLLTGFMLAMAVMMPATGWLLERFTTRATFAAAVTVFLVGTVLAATAPTFAIMLLARVLQAIGTAIVMPLLMTVVMTVVPERVRGTVMGLIAVVMAVGPALGPSLAGVVLARASWHAIFLVMVPLVAASGAAGLLFVRNVGQTRRVPFDTVSMVLSVGAFGGLVYAISSVGVIVEGGDGTVPLVLLAVGVLSLVFFVRRQIRLSRSGEALLDLRPLVIRNYTLCLTALLLMHAALLGMLNVLPLYLQQSLLTTALVAGLAVMPGGLLEGLLSPVFGRIFDRVGPRPLVVPGAVLVTATLLLLGTVDENTSVAFVVAMHVIFSLGLAMLYTPLMTTALGSLPQSLYGHGSAILNTLTQLAAAFGTAFMIAIYSGVAAGMQAGGIPREAALGEGAALANLLTGGIAAVATVLTLFIRPAADSHAEPVPHSPAD